VLLVTYHSPGFNRPEKHLVQSANMKNYKEATLSFFSSSDILFILGTMAIVHLEAL
jgi:hypothetical protein